MHKRIGCYSCSDPNRSVIHISLIARSVRLIHVGSAADLCDPPALADRKSPVGTRAPAIAGHYCRKLPRRGSLVAAVVV